jgi:hypothetical protein
MSGSSQLAADAKSCSATVPGSNGASRTAGASSLLGSGASNTRPGLKNETPSAGIDTLRLLWKLDDEPSFRAATALASGPRRPEVAGWRLDWFPGLELLAAEGHPGGDELLGTAEQAAASESRLRDVLGGGYGIELPEGCYAERGGIARMDAAVNLPFPPLEGRAVLMGIAALDMPRLKPVVYGKPIETVGLIHVAGRRLLGRVYDYGESRKVAERGSVVRFEDQRRFTNLQRLPAAVLTDEEVRHGFRKRFESLWQSSRGLTVGTLPVVARKLRDRLDAGEITRRQLDRAAGSLLVELAAPKQVPGRKPGAKVHGLGRASYYNRRRELRELGLVIADEFYEPVEVDLGAVLERALDEGVWGRG